jgi:hypothetical protein
MTSSEITMFNIVLSKVLRTITAFQRQCDWGLGGELKWRTDDNICNNTCQLCSIVYTIQYTIYNTVCTILYIQYIQYMSCDEGGRHTASKPWRSRTASTMSSLFRPRSLTGSRDGGSPPVASACSETLCRLRTCTHHAYPIRAVFTPHNPPVHKGGRDTHVVPRLESCSYFESPSALRTTTNRVPRPA